MFWVCFYFETGEVWGKEEIPGREYGFEMKLKTHPKHTL
jgi:hypothetical protein